MSRLLDLPSEILTAILNELETCDQKAFREISHACKAFATPLVFHKVAFDLEVGGCDSLHHIAHTPELCRHVRHLYLERRDGLANFTDYNGFESANIYEFSPWSAEDPIAYERPKKTSVPLSREAWMDLSEDGRRRLYDRYTEDEEAVAAYMSRLSHELVSSVTLRMVNVSEPEEENSDARRTLRTLLSAVDALPTLTTFYHNPAYEGYCWGLSWRGVEFHPDGIIAYGNYGNNPDIDSLQLYVALRSVLRAPNGLVSAGLFTRGHAFWGLAHLRRLLDWRDHSHLVHV